RGAHRSQVRFDLAAGQPVDPQDLVVDQTDPIGQTAQQSGQGRALFRQRTALDLGHTVERRQRRTPVGQRRAAAEEQEVIGVAIQLISHQVKQSVHLYQYGLRLR